MEGRCCTCAGSGGALLHMRGEFGAEDEWSQDFFQTISFAFRHSEQGTVLSVDESSSKTVALTNSEMMRSLWRETVECEGACLAAHSKRQGLPGQDCRFIVSSSDESNYFEWCL